MVRAALAQSVPLRAITLIEAVVEAVAVGGVTVMVFVVEGVPAVQLAGSVHE